MAFDLKGAITSIAPTLASMLGGPMAGTAVAALEGIFGLTPGAGVDGITQAAQIGMTPDVVAAMRAADQHHAEVIAQHGIDLEKLNLDFQTAMTQAEVADRSSAREREKVLKDATPANLAYMMIGGFFTVSIAQLIALMAFSNTVAGIPPEGWLLIGNISGYLANEAKAASGYYFGTTQNSGKKDELLYQSQPTPPTT